MPELLSASRDLPQAFMLQIRVLANERSVQGCSDLHEGIVDRDDEDLARIFELGRADVAWDVAVAACWAYEGVSTDDRGKAGEASCN